MKKFMITSATLISLCFSNFAYGQQAAWVNNQGCYCGGYPTSPVTYIVRGTGSAAEKSATQAQLQYWNLYALIYPGSTIDAGLGAPGNGKNEVNTFITPADALSIYGYSMSPSLYGVAINQPSASFGLFNECQNFSASGCGNFTETDVLINATFSSGWTTDPNDYSHALVQTTALHEIGHTWGAHHVFSLPAFGDSYSTMNYMNDDSGQFVTRMDANTIRAHYPTAAQSGVDVGIFPFIYGNSQYGETYTSVNPTSVIKGDTINVSNFLVQNIGTAAVSNVVVTFYLSTDTVIQSTDTVLGTVTFASLPVNADNDQNAALTIPSTIADGTYYIGAIVTVGGAEDAIAVNNKFIIGRPTRTQITVSGGTCGTSSSSSATAYVTHNLYPETTTVQVGGTLPVLVEAINNSSCAVTFNVQSYVILPDGNTLWSGQGTSTLAAGETRTHTHFVNVPPLAGSYTFGVILTDASGTQVDNDSFGFTVVAAQ